MAEKNNGVFVAGAALVWRRQRILWWVFVVNLVLGLLGASGARAQLDRVFQHSLAGHGFRNGFDMGLFLDLITDPQVALMRSAGSSVVFAALFLLFMLFVGGGILQAYRDDRRLTMEEFFGASGAFFWRFVRLLLASLIPLVILGILLSGIAKVSGRIGDQAVSDMTGFYAEVVGLLIVALFGLFIRLWFDIAQVRAVVQNERGMWRNAWKTFGITLRNLGGLYPAYFAIGVVALLVIVAGLAVWAHLPAAATPVTFLVLELIMLAQLASRLWQRACAMTWYKRHAELVPAVAVAYTTPHPAEILETAPLPAEPEASAQPEPIPPPPVAEPPASPAAAETEPLRPGATLLSPPEPSSDLPPETGAPPISGADLPPQSGSRMPPNPDTPPKPDTAAKE